MHPSMPFAHIAASPARLQLQRPQGEVGGVGIVQHIMGGVLPVAQRAQHRRRARHHRRLLPQPGRVKLSFGICRESKTVQNSST